MHIRLCGQETAAPPVTPFYFESRWNLDCEGIILGVEFDPATGEIRKLRLFDPGTENDGWYETPEAFADFLRLYPQTAKAVKETISQICKSQNNA